MSNLVILAASVFEIVQKNKHTDKQRQIPYPLQLPSACVTR